MKLKRHCHEFLLRNGLRCTILAPFFTTEPGDANRSQGGKQAETCAEPYCATISYHPSTHSELRALPPGALPPGAEMPNRDPPSCACSTTFAHTSTSSGVCGACCCLGLLMARATRVTVALGSPEVLVSVYGPLPPYWCFTASSFHPERSNILKHPESCMAPS